MCEKRLPASAFNKNKDRADGLVSYCRNCQAEYHREWQKKAHKTEKYRQYRVAVQKKWATLNREKTKAHAIAQKVDLADKSCEGCGSNTKLHRHHPDYSKPLFVRILCQSCHVQEHWL